MRRSLWLLLIAAFSLSIAFSLGGCAKKQAAVEEEMAPAAEETAVKPGEPGYEKIYEEPMAAMEESLESEAVLSKEAQDILEGRTSGPLLPVYFDFDKSNIRKDQRARIEKNSAFLKENSGVKVRIEGNCDERGTNEYNLALGERRALSAKKYLQNLGIHPDRMHTLSFGEEKPLLYGHDEYSWAQNRRDDFVIVGQ